MSSSRYRQMIMLVVVVVFGLGLVGQPGLANDSGRLTYVASSHVHQNSLLLHVNGPNIELLDGQTHAVLRSRPLDGTRSVIIQGAAGAVDDSLTVDLDNGPIVLPDGITFDGGVGGYDVLVVTGGQVARSLYTATGPGSGSLIHDGTRIIFSNLEPVVDTVPAASLTINATGSPESINIVDGPNIAGTQTTEVNSGTNTFEKIDFANKTDVTVNGLGGNDTLTLNNPNPAVGLSKLVIDTGGNGLDAISVAAFNLPGGTLSLKNANTISQSGPFTVTNLMAEGGASVDLTSAENNVTTLAGGVTHTSAVFAFRASVSSLAIGTVDGVSGITTHNGPVNPIENAQPNGSLIVNSPIDTANGDISLRADNMTINATLTTGTTGAVYLDTESPARPMTLGTKPGTSLGLLQSDLSLVTTGVLRLGDESADTGGLTVTAAIIAPTGSPGKWTTLDLRQAADISEGASGSVSVANLVLRAAGNGRINFSNPNNDKTTLAGFTNGQSFSFIDKKDTIIGSVNGVNGLSTNGGALNITINNSGLTVNNNVIAGTGPITLTATESDAATDNVSIAAGVTIASTASDVVLNAGDQVLLAAGSAVQTSGSGAVTLRFSLNDADGLGGGTIQGTIKGANPSAVGGGASDTLLIDFANGATLANGLTYNGGTGVNALTVSDDLSVTPHTYNINSSSMLRDGITTITYANLQTLTTTGGNGNDIFNVTPVAGVTINVNGGAPQTLPGDQLNVDMTGVTTPAWHVSSVDGASFAGSWTFGNRQPVNFTSIETQPNLLHVFLPLLMK